VDNLHQAANAIALVIIGDKADKPVLNKNVPSKPVDRITVLKAEKLGPACRLTGSYMNWFYGVNGQVITRRETRGSCVYIGGR
jgi:hypothetical protein